MRQSFSGEVIRPRIMAMERNARGKLRLIATDDGRTILYEIKPREALIWIETLAAYAREEMVNYLESKVGQ